MTLPGNMIRTVAGRVLLLAIVGVAAHVSTVRWMTFREKHNSTALVPGEELGAGGAQRGEGQGSASRFSPDSKSFFQLAEPPLPGTPINLPPRGTFDELVMHDRRLHVIKVRAASALRRALGEKCQRLHFAGTTEVVVPLRLEIVEERARVVSVGSVEVQRGAPLEQRLIDCIATALPTPYPLPNPSQGGLWSRFRNVSGDSLIRFRFKEDGTSGPILRARSEQP